MNCWLAQFDWDAVSNLIMAGTSVVSLSILIFSRSEIKALLAQNKILKDQFDISKTLAEESLIPFFKTVNGAELDSIIHGNADAAGKIHVFRIRLINTGATATELHYNSRGPFTITTTVNEVVREAEIDIGFDLKQPISTSDRLVGDEQFVILSYQNAFKHRFSQLIYFSDGWYFGIGPPTRIMRNPLSTS